MDHREGQNWGVLELVAVAHELRNSVAGVRLLAEAMATEHGITDPWKGYADRIAGAAATVAEIVETSLDSARVALADREWAWGEFALSEVCGAAAAAALRMAGLRSLSLSMDLEPGLGTMRGNSAAVRRLLVNLLMNACRCTERGSVVLRAQRPRGNPARVEFSVRDTGRGLSAAARKELGRPLWRDRTPDDRLLGGAGMGLWICRCIAAAHGGWVEAATREGEGCTFTAVLRTDLGEPRDHDRPREIAVTDGAEMRPPMIA
ncbi:MAG: HAMP domain-containing sensor histidine kinase [Phycisphaerales bacterium]